VAATGYWRKRIFRNSYTHRGQRVAVKGWSVKIQHRRIRRTFSLAATSRAAAAIEAKAIYQTIVTQGWDAVVPHGHRRLIAARSGAGDEPDPFPKTDVRYWRRRLLRRRHRLLPGAAPLAVRRMMVEYGEYFWRDGWGSLYSVFGGNPLAAMPSLHFATSVMAALLLAEVGPLAGALGFGYAATLGFALVYLGEHYVVDLLGGVALTGAVRRLGPRAGPALARLGRAVAALEARAHEAI